MQEAVAPGRLRLSSGRAVQVRSGRSLEVKRREVLYPLALFIQLGLIRPVGLVGFTMPKYGGDIAKELLFLPQKLLFPPPPLDEGRLKDSSSLLEYPQ